MSSAVVAVIVAVAAGVAIVFLALTHTLMLLLLSEVFAVVVSRLYLLSLIQLFGVSDMNHKCPSLVVNKVS